MKWAADQLSFEIVADETDDPVVTIIISTPAGVLKVMAEVEECGTVLLLKGTHVQAEAVNKVGVTNLRLIAQVVLERLGYDAIEIEGALRTTGAGPGHTPRRLRFTR